MINWVILISSVGNNEAKAMTLLIMQHDRIYSGSELFREFIGAQGEKVGWRPNKSIPFQYCQDSLSPIGLVAKEAIDEQLTTWGYGITPLGEREGKALIGLLLDFSEEHPELSLLQVWGSTNSPSKSKYIQTSEGEAEYKNRAPITRLKIFWELVTRQLPIRTRDLANAIGEDESKIGHHLDQLLKSNIISYETIGSDQPYAFYKLSKERPINPPKQYKTSPFLTKQIYDLFLNSDPSKQIAREEIADSLIQTTPKIEKVDKKSLQRTISSICSYLAKENYLKQVKYGRDLQSEITLSDQQKATLLELVTLIDRFQRQDSKILEEGRRKAMVIINNPERVANLMKKAKENSGNANKLPIEEHANYFLSLIQDHTGSTNTDLYNLQDRKPKLAKGSIRGITQLLEKKNKVTVSREKNQKHFTAVDSEGEN